VYFGAVVIVVTTLVHGVTPRRAEALRRQFGVDRRTLARWRQWWQAYFPSSAFWREGRARFSPPVAVAGLPATLLERFAVAGHSAGLVFLLRFLAPL
jgi:hypothetical protein